jgi:hypothetical protein
MLNVKEDSPRAFSALRFLPAAQIFVFDDGRYIYGISPNCQQLWTIAAQSKLNGWASADSHLYVQDGPVICQYDLNALLERQMSSAASAPEPSNAFNLATRSHWTAQKPGQPDFHTWFPKEEPNGHYSAPTLWTRDPSGVEVFVLTSQGMVIPMPANLYELDARQISKFAEYPPDEPLLVAAAGEGDSAALQYSSGGKLVLLERPAGEPRFQFKTARPPAAGASHWREMVAIAAVRDGFPQSISLGGADTVCAFAGTPPWLAFVRGPQVLLANGPWTCLGGASARPFCAPPCLLAAWGVTFLYALTKDEAGVIRFEQSRISQPVAAPGATTKNAWPLFESQFAGILPWLNAGAAGPAPFEDDARAICRRAFEEALGVRPDAVGHVDADMAARGVRAAPGMIAIAAASHSADALIEPLRELCDLPMAAACDALVAAGYNAEQVARALRQPYPSGPQTAALLRGKGFDLVQVAAALHAVDYTPFHFLAGVVPESRDNPEWWLRITRPIQIPTAPTAEAETIAKAMRAGGFTFEKVAVSVRGFTALPKIIVPVVIAGALLRAGWPEVSAETVFALLQFAGYDTEYTGLVMKGVYDYPPGPLPHFKFRFF